MSHSQSYTHAGAHQQPEKGNSSIGDDSGLGTSKFKSTMTVTNVCTCIYTPFDTIITLFLFNV